MSEKLTIQVTDRRGAHLDTIVCTAKDRPAVHTKLKAKYGSEHFCFAATPSDGTTGPLRKPGARSFVMNAHD